MRLKYLIGQIILLSVLFSLLDCKKENQLPTCKITYPNNGDKIKQGDTIDIMVDADDSDGLVSEVKFYINNIGVFSDIIFPYRYRWITKEETFGEYYIKVTAKDNDDGLKTDECSVLILGNAIVITIDANSITLNSAISGGNITNDGGSQIIKKGVCWNVYPNPTYANNHTYDGSGSDSFTSTITGLFPNTKYYVKAYTTNSLGTSYGNEISFTTLKTVPTVVTGSINELSSYAVLINMNIISDGGVTITSSGVCWSTSPNPTTNDSTSHVGEGTGVFECAIRSLLPYTKYYFRAYATNAMGTSYGSEINHTNTSNSSNETEIFTDSHDGQTYITVKIGNQWWMAENLNIGTIIESNQEQTNNQVIEKYCFENSPRFCKIFGGLYQWDEMMRYVTTTGSKGICPDGWHIPSDDDWKTLEMRLGMSQSQVDNIYERGTDQGKQLKVNGTSGFEGLIYTYRHMDGNFQSLDNNSNFWTSTQKINTTDVAVRRVLYTQNSYVGRLFGYKTIGLSVRCVKDSINK